MTRNRKQAGRRLFGIGGTAGVIAALGVLLMSTLASASSVVTAVVDVSSPFNAVTLAQGATGNVTINMSVTGNQDGTATFDVNRDWVLSGGTFTGSNPQTFTVPPRAGGDPATTFSTTGTVSVGALQATGTFSLQVPAFNITNSNATGGKLGAGSPIGYSVTVVAASDSTPPVITKVITGTAGTSPWYTSDVSVAWTVTDAQSPVTIDSGCGTQPFTAETTGAESSCVAHSLGGTASDSVTIQIDKTGPSASLSPSGDLGLNGWYTSNVTVSTGGTDSISDIASCTANQSFTSNTTGQTVNGSCTNGAGLSTNATPITIKIDKTAPTAELNVTSGTQGANGWYTSDVEVTTSGEDGTSGVTCDPVQTFTNEIGGTQVTGSCTNGAGVTTQADPITIKIDKSNPTAVLAPSGTVGDNDWYITDVTVATNGSDTVSDPTTCTADQTFTADTTGTEVNGSCTNDAGLTQNADPITIKIDKTGPTAVLSVTSGTPGANGWYTSNVQVTTSGVDATSGVTCTAVQTLSAETGGTEVNGSCTNGAGLVTNAAPITIKIDKTGPSAALAVSSGDLGSNGWYVTDVTVDTDGADGVSGPTTCSADQTFSADTTGTEVNGSCTNDAGLTTNATPITIKIDQTDPTDIVINGGPADGAHYPFGSVPPAPNSCTATDATSGFDSCVVTGYSAAVGTHTITATARDSAGNEATATRTYTVDPLELRGFYQPVDMDQGNTRVVNTVKAGSTVPLKFEVFAGGTELTNTSAIVQPIMVTKVNCTSGVGIEDPIESTVSGNTSLRYDTTGGQFIYNWKTPTVKGCYDVVVGTIDGSAIRAHFNLK